MGLRSRFASLICSPCRCRDGTGCFPCPVNTYALDGHCELCPGNRISPVGTSSVGGCFCAPGSVLTPTATIDRCKPCPNGQVSADESRCVPCGPGQEANKAKTACVACEANKFNDREGGTCQSCPVYQKPTTDKTDCTFSGCPVGFAVVTIPGGPSTCTMCDDDQFVSAAGSCQTCPSGKVPTA